MALISGDGLPPGRGNDRYAAQAALPRGSEPSVGRPPRRCRRTAMLRPRHRQRAARVALPLGVDQRGHRGQRSVSPTNGSANDPQADARAPGGHSAHRGCPGSSATWRPQAQPSATGGCGFIVAVAMRWQIGGHRRPVFPLPIGKAPKGLPSCRTSAITSPRSEHVAFPSATGTALTAVSYRGPGSAAMPGPRPAPARGFVHPLRCAEQA